MLDFTADNSSGTHIKIYWLSLRDPLDCSWNRCHRPNKDIFLTSAISHLTFLKVIYARVAIWYALILLSLDGESVTTSLIQIENCITYRLKASKPVVSHSDIAPTTRNSVQYLNWSHCVQSKASGLLYYGAQLGLFADVFSINLLKSLLFNVY